MWLFQVITETMCVEVGCQVFYTYVLQLTRDSKGVTKQSEKGRNMHAIPLADAETPQRSCRKGPHWELSPQPPQLLIS